MRKLFTAIVNHPKSILITFAVLVVLCLGCQSLIGVNYDMNDYLPADTPSTVAMHKMQEAFGGDIPNARVMLYQVSVPEALVYKARLQAVEGVKEVIWLDDSESVTVPLEFMDAHTRDTYYKDGNALMVLTIDKNHRVTAVADIRQIIGEENCMTGSAVSAAWGTTSTEKEVPIVGACGIAFAVFVLMITTTSWAVPILILIGLGVAVFINAGTNLMFGEVSFVTNAAGKILQMAVSLDYSVFLLHRFEECHEKEPDEKKAMVDALMGSASSITASGITTVIGFLALCFMRYGIGPDLGLALAKGILIGLITVFVFMPVFLLKTYPLILKTKHKSLLPSFRGFGKVIYRFMMPLVLVFAMAVVPSFLASNANSFYFGSSHLFGLNTQLGRDTQSIEEVFGKQDTYVLMIPKESTATERSLSDAIHKLPEVTNIVSYVDTVGEVIPKEYLEKDMLSKLQSEDYTRMVITVDAAYEGDEVVALITRVRELAESFYPGGWLLAGEGVSTLDLKLTVMDDMLKVNLMAIGAVFLVLLLTMRSLVLPILLVLGIETAIWINLSVPYFGDKSIFYIAYLIISSIQLGATVDYAILFTDRYLEFRALFPRRQAIIENVNAVTASILTSGGVLTVVGFVMGKVSTHGLLAQLGILLGRGTLCSLLIVLFVLPGLLYLFDGLIQRTRKDLKFINDETEIHDCEMMESENVSKCIQTGKEAVIS